MGYLTKQQIIDANDLLSEVVSLPELGGDVIVKGMSAEMSAAIVEASNTSGDFTYRMIGASLFDNDGNQLFVDDEFALLKKKSPYVIKKLMEACNRVNLFDKAAAEKNLTADAGESLA